jgi:hypothetical protein
MVAAFMGMTAPAVFAQAMADAPVSLPSVHTATAAAGAVAAASPTAAAQAATADGSIAATPAADPTLGITFDVVSIKHAEQGISRVTDPVDGDGITITNSTLREIVQWNYGIRVLGREQLQGIPEWFSSIDENFEIHAKIAPSDVAAWQ